MFLDVLYNDEGSIVLIQGKGEPLYDIPTFEIHECRDGFGRVYVCKNQVYTENVTLNINGKDWSTRVNIYPSFRDEIIMSTCIKNEDDYIVQWIRYHMLLGVSRFILYDNSENKTNTHSEPPARTDTNVRDLLDNYIKEGIVLIIHWPFENHYVFQPGQINHSLHTFRTSRYIGFLDVDEYVNPQGTEIDLRRIFDKNCTTGGYSLKSRQFQNFNRLPEDGYNFFNIYTCDNVLEDADPNVRGDKIFACPRNVNTIVVHHISNGIEPDYLSKELIYFNHYRFLNKISRGRGYVHMIDQSIKQFSDLLVNEVSHTK